MCALGSEQHGSNLSEQRRVLKGRAYPVRRQAAECGDNPVLNGLAEIGRRDESLEYLIGSNDTESFGRRRCAAPVAGDKVLDETVDDRPGRIGAKSADGVQSDVLVCIVDQWEDIFVTFEPGFAERPDSGLPQFISFETRIRDNAVELFAGKWTVAEFGQDEHSFQAQLWPVVIVPDETADLFLPKFGSESGGGARRFEGDTFFGFPADEVFECRNDLVTRIIAKAQGFDRCVAIYVSVGLQIV